MAISSGAAVERLTAWGTKYHYAKMHTGDPGALGTANAATETTRVNTTWDTPDDSVAGTVTMTHTNQLDLTSVPASEDYAYVSYWSASSGGDYGGNGPITSDPVVIGDNWFLPVGALIVSQPCA
jgi:hypothetical protein